MKSHFDFYQYIFSKPQGVAWHPENGFSPLEKSVNSEYALTLISPALSFDNVHAVLSALHKHCRILSVSLHPLSGLLSCYGLVVAVDITDTEAHIKELAAKLAQQFSMEIALTHLAPSLSEPGLLVMDMDSTMIQMECIDEIARLAGRYDDVAAVTEQAMQGKLDFAQSLKTRVACLEGVEESALLQIKSALPLMPGLVTLLTELKKRQWVLAIASGGFTYFADHLKAWLELDDAVSNVLALENGKLTGKTKGRVIDAQVKAETVVALQQKYNIAPHQTVAIGDGANDVLMMRQASLGVAFHAKPTVRTQADAAVNHLPLDALLLLLKP
ncbi:phosphoserine phosphatase SerB [Alteromonas sediminis]|uniref:Phosphoserine phosphatase n=1 Tax=Alteromonas sediminis TaxID=2259342 RepID=A0A3N5YA64_9ALTE|nr:phosphoserine phosphatase SerB [Alteromonas sediminis]RPJ65595.1 phosphoserine phosphatase SerB [Alteromonas sediminis]